MTKKELQEEFLSRVKSTEDLQKTCSEHSSEYVFSEGWKQAFRLAWSLLALLDEGKA